MVLASVAVEVAVVRDVLQVVEDVVGVEGAIAPYRAGVKMKLGTWVLAFDLYPFDAAEDRSLYWVKQKIVGVQRV